MITRAVAIASLPLQSLQGDVTTLNSQSSALSSLGATFQALQTSLQAVGTASTGAPSAKVSDTSALSANAGTGALPGTYTIQVDDPGSSTVTLSKAGLTTVTDPSSDNLSTASSFTLTVNGDAHTIVPSGSSLDSLASAINSSGDGVSATIVNIGSNATPDYRLSIQSNNLGGDTIQLNDGSSDLLDTLSTGTDSLYKVNGGTADIAGTSGQVTLAPGLTVSLLSQSSSPVTITVANDFSGLQSSLSNFVSAYNAAVDALAQNRGQSGGALTGDSLVYTLTNVLDQIAQYTSPSGNVTSPADLGLNLDDTGHLSFNASTFSGAGTADIQSFLGSVDSSGFLQTANNDLTAVTDPTNGLIAGDYGSVQTQIANDNSEISDDQARVSSLQTTLQAQLSQADAAIATLESQKTYFTELFTAEYGNGTGSGS